MERLPRVALRCPAHLPRRLVELRSLAIDRKRIIPRWWRLEHYVALSGLLGRGAGLKWFLHPGKGGTAMGLKHFNICDGCDLEELTEQPYVPSLIKPACISIDASPDTKYDLCPSCKQRLLNYADPKRWPRFTKLDEGVV